MIMMEKEKLMKKKMDLYLEKNVKVHIKKTTKGYFNNGYITGRESDTIYEFEDDKQGKIYLFCLEIYDVIEFTKPEEDDD